VTRRRCRLASSKRRRSKRKRRRRRPVNEQEKRVLEDLTIDLLGAYRRLYLRHGGSPLRCRDELLSRMRLVTNQTRDPREWTARLLRSLRIPSPDKWASHCMESLVHEIGVVDDQRGWQRMLKNSAEYLIAAVQLRAEERREAWLAQHKEEEETQNEDVALQR
jgi:hypothetical protein